MKQVILTIEENRRIAPNTFRMTLLGDTSAVTAPGQFVNIQLPGRYLRRPISVCDCEPGRLTLIYKVLGEGTEQMTEMQPGSELDVLTGLGNGFDLSKSGPLPLILGGGIGIPPMYWLAKELIGDGRISMKVTVILGFNTADEIFFVKEFRDLGCSVIVTTVDGSYGIKGYVTTPVSAQFSAKNDTETAKPAFTSYFACGPMPMLKAVHKALGGRGQLSLEERMGCGFGACMGCSIKTKDGYKRVCKDGPVFDKEELPW